METINDDQVVYNDRSQMETEAYQIKQDKYKDDDTCECGHIRAAHGSNGFICAAGTCNCQRFTLTTITNQTTNLNEGAD